MGTIFLLLIKLVARLKMSFLYWENNIKAGGMHIPTKHNFQSLIHYHYYPRTYKCLLSHFKRTLVTQFKNSSKRIRTKIPTTPNSTKTRLILWVNAIAKAGMVSAREFLPEECIKHNIQLNVLIALAEAIPALTIILPYSIRL